MSLHVLVKNILLIRSYIIPYLKTTLVLYAKVFRVDMCQLNAKMVKVYYFLWVLICFTNNSVKKHKNVVLKLFLPQNYLVDNKLVINI